MVWMNFSKIVPLTDHLKAYKQNDGQILNKIPELFALAEALDLCLAPLACCLTCTMPVLAYKKAFWQKRQFSCHKSLFLYTGNKGALGPPCFWMVSVSDQSEPRWKPRGCDCCLLFEGFSCIPGSQIKTFEQISGQVHISYNCSAFRTLLRLSSTYNSCSTKLFSPWDVIKARCPPAFWQ